MKKARSHDIFRKGSAAVYQDSCIRPIHLSGNFGTPIFHIPFCLLGKLSSIPTCSSCGAVLAIFVPSLNRAFVCSSATCQGNTSSSTRSTNPIQGNNGVLKSTKPAQLQLPPTWGAGIREAKRINHAREGRMEESKNRVLLMMKLRRRRCKNTRLACSLKSTTGKNRKNRIRARSKGKATSLSDRTVSFRREPRKAPRMRNACVARERPCLASKQYHV